MKTRSCIAALVLAIVFGLGSLCIFAQDSSGQGKKSARSSQAQSADHERTEGEKRFQQNCGRCHHAPESLSARATPAVLMHMRVRATLTAEDQRLILKFMAP